MSQSSHLPVPTWKNLGRSQSCRLAKFVPISTDFRSASNNDNRLVTRAETFNSRIPISSILRRRESKEYRRPNSLETSSGGSSSSSSKESSPIKKDANSTVSTLMQLTQLTDTFPSSSTAKKFGKFSIWITPPEVIVGSKSHIEHIQKIASLMHQIDEYFKPSSYPPTDNIDRIQTINHNNKILGEIKQYLSNCDILKTELQKETKYQALFQNPSKNINKKIRENIMDWIVSVKKNFNYEIKTVHLTMFLIDAYTQTKKTDGWILLALTALLMASKLNERELCIAKLQTLKRKYQFLNKYTKQDVATMERKILTELQFNIFPTFSTFFVDLAINSGQIDFQSDNIKRQIEILANDILLCSLREHSHGQVRNSLKAQAALKVATEYVLFNFLDKRDNHRSFEDRKIRKLAALNKCLSIFCDLIDPKKRSFNGKGA